MWQSDPHLSDEDLILLADGEVRGPAEARIRDHLAACWPCRRRIRELDEAVAEFSRMHRDDPAGPLPAPDGPRALLKARLREESARAGPSPGLAILHGFGYAAAVFGVLAVVWVAADPGDRAAMPRSDLTPGAVRRVAVSDVCSANLGDNSEVGPAVQQLVFAEYGMPHAEAARYEVDYLITPALGGSDDIRNLWPQPYSGSTWNAYVKDALEARLRGMVCAGQLDLATAQREIADNWIAAYRKYFRTSQPLAAHRR